MLPYVASRTILHPGTDLVWIDAGKAFGPQTAVSLLSSGVLLSSIVVLAEAPNSARLLLLAMATYYGQ